MACNGQCDNLEDFDITMAFQPVVDVLQQKIYAYEALVRGRDGAGAGAVISKVTPEQMYGFDQACRVTAIKLAAKLGLTKRLSINFLPNAVYHPEACLRKTLSAAKEANFPTELITFEFTENEEVIDRDHLAGIIQAYKKQNFVTAIDDFGTGFSGLSLLADFQTDIIKLDRCLINDIHINAPRQAIVAGILHMANRLDIQLIAEGVETLEEYQTLKTLGIRYMQGFLLAKPAFEALVDEAEINWPEGL